MPLYRGCTFGCAAQLHGHVCCGPFYINTSTDLPVRAALQRHGRLARPLSRPTHPSAPVYKCHGQLVRPTKNTRCYPFYVFCQHILNHPSKTTLPCCILYAGKLPVAKRHYTAEMETRQTLFGTGGCPYSTDSRTGLQCRGRLSRPHRFTVLRLTHL